MNRKKRGRPSTFERERTVARAMDQYWQEGLHALSINELCRRTGASKPALYRELGGEDGLLDAVLERYLTTVISPMASQLSDDHSFHDNAETLLRFIVSAHEAPGGCLLVKMRGAADRLGPLSRARVEAAIGDVRGVYEDILTAAMNRGEVRDDISVAFGARYLDTQMTTALRQIGTGEDPDEVRDQAALAIRALAPAHKAF